MSARVGASGLEVDASLYRLVRDEIAPGTGVKPQKFWEGFSEIVGTLSGGNRALLDRRDALQARYHQVDVAACQREAALHDLRGAGLPAVSAPAWVPSWISRCSEGGI